MSAPTESPLPAHQAIGLITAGAVAFAMAGCVGGGGGGGGGGGAVPPPVLSTGDSTGPFDPHTGPKDPLTITAITLAVKTTGSTTLTLTGAADASGVAQSSTGTSHRFELRTGRELPADPGTNGATLDCRFTLTDDDGDEVSGHAIINPDHNDVINSDPAVLVERRRTLDATGFGATWSEIAASLHLSHDQLVEMTVEKIRTEHFTAPPDFLSEPTYTYRFRRNWSEKKRRAHKDDIGDWSRDLRRWWHLELRETPSPLTERLVLFWHGVWCSDLRRCDYPHQMYEQLQLIREHALNFRELAKRMCKDPAMVRYLDSDTNVVGAPNENFARELMELFMLGELRGYTEEDIPEVARCFTGYSLYFGEEDQSADQKPAFAFQFEPSLHDAGEKTFFGQDHGNVDGDYVVDQILNMRRCAEYICERLVIEFIGRNADGKPDGRLVRKLTGILYPSYDLKPVLKALFRDNLFKSSSRVATRVKSPAELVIGTYRRLELDWSHEEKDDPTAIYGRTASCDHDLLYPPNVAGWPDGVGWMDAKNILERRWHGENIARNNWDKVPAHIVDAGIEQLLLQRPMIAEPDLSNQKNHLISVLVDPAYQVV